MTRMRFLLVAAFLTALVPGLASAQTVRPGRLIQGHPVAATGTVPVRWVFPMGNKIVVVNTAGEIFTHEVGRLVGPAIRSNGATFRFRAEHEARFVFPMGNRIVMVTNNGDARGELKSYGAPIKIEKGTSVTIEKSQ